MVAAGEVGAAVEGRQRSRRRQDVGRNPLGPRPVRRLHHETRLGHDGRAGLPGRPEYEKYLDAYAGFGGSSDLASGDAGAMMRQGAVDRWWQRGAYEQLGGFNDAMYSFTGSGDALPRLTSGLRIGAGLAAAGAIAPQLATAMGMGAIGTTVAPFLLAGGAIAAAGTVGMEAYNALHPDAAPVTWGGIGRSLASQFHYQNALMRTVVQKGGGTTGRSLDEEFRTPGSAADYGLSEEDVLANMTDQQRAIYEYTGETPQARQIRMMTETMATITGEDATSIAPVLRKLGRAMGSLEGKEQYGQTLASVAHENNYTVAELGQEMFNAADARGYQEGTQGYSGYISPLPANVAGGAGAGDGDHQQHRPLRRDALALLRFHLGR